MAQPLPTMPRRYMASIATCVNAPAIWETMRDVSAKNWHLGLTAFGGPPVHFQILHKKLPLYQEIFALSQALPGPASTKMLFCINYIHRGLMAGLCALTFWCLPGALGMYALSLGVSRIGTTLPALVYALLSGLNAATVGIITLAAVTLAQKAITDKLSRALVFLGGVGGMLYTALWYFPVLMMGAGCATLVWDLWLRSLLRRIGGWWRRRRRGRSNRAVGGNEIEHAAVEMERGLERNISSPRRLEDNPEGSLHHRSIGTVIDEHDCPPKEDVPTSLTNNNTAISISRVDTDATAASSSARIIPSTIELKVISWKTGTIVLTSFILSFAAIMTVRSVLHRSPLLVALFANLYLAGTIIFGGGPVVIPLLREYIVAEGWVSPRDLLLGLPLIQSFPGPNFNFAVYLGAVTASQSRTSLPSFAGAIIAFIAILIPGIVILVGIMGIWKHLRSRRWLLSLLRGVNASAVGLVFTAVYKLWQIGYVDGDNVSGSRLGSDAWWVTITATSFVGGAWFGLSAPFAILLGGVMGMGGFGVVKG